MESSIGLILGLKRLREEDREFEVTLGYIIRSVKEGKEGKKEREGKERGRRKKEEELRLLKCASF